MTCVLSVCACGETGGGGGGYACMAIEGIIGLSSRRGRGGGGVAEMQLCSFTSFSESVLLRLWEPENEGERESVCVADFHSYDPLLLDHNYWAPIG